MITRRLRRDSRRVQWLCLRVAFGVLDRLAPGLAGRWVARLWCTVPRTSGRSRDDRPIPGLGVVPSVRSTMMLSGGRRIAVERWGEGGGPIYLVHGWGGWRGQLGGFIGPILSRGFSVVAFDMPSHGESGPGVLGPRRSHGWEMMETLTAVVARHGRPHAIVGHSLGCAITAFAISEGFASGSTDRMAANALAPARLGFVAPTLGPLPHIRGVIELLGCSHRTEKAMLKRISALIHRPVTDYDTCALPSPMPPTLIVHDYRDKEVAHDQAVKLAASWPAADVHSTDGLGHRRILRDPDVIERITEFVTTGRTLAGFRAADGVPPSESPKRTAARTPRE